MEYLDMVTWILHVWLGFEKTGMDAVYLPSAQVPAIAILNFLEMSHNKYESEMFLWGHI